MDNTDARPVRRFAAPERIASCLVLAAAVVAVDFVTGKHIEFPIVYILPVAMAAWFGHLRTAYLLAIGLPLARVCMHYAWEVKPEPVSLLLNGTIAGAALVCYCYLVARTAWQTRALAKELKILKGILPICASCRKIRTEDGNYQALDQYISERSDTRFSHGICPNCARTLYPDNYQKIVEEQKSMQPDSAGRGASDA